MNHFAYYFFWAMAFLNLFTTGISLGSIGRPHQPTGPWTLMISVILSVMYFVACFNMVKP